MDNKYKYVVIFIRCKDEILMLNRNKPYWMGMWNAVGGKIESGEDKVLAAVREVMEETGIKIKQNELHYLADLNWFIDDEAADGTYCFLYDIKKKIKTPVATREGVLEWKNINWILSLDNRGIVPDVPILLKEMFTGDFCELTAYYNKEDMLVRIEKKKEDRVKVDNFKEITKKAGHVAGGAGAVVYEKGKEVLEKAITIVNETIDKAKKGIVNTIEELNVKGEEILNKNKKSE